VTEDCNVSVELLTIKANFKGMRFRKESANLITIWGMKISPYAISRIPKILSSSSNNTHFVEIYNKNNTSIESDTFIFFDFKTMKMWYSIVSYL